MLIDEQRFRHDCRNGLIRHLAVDIEVLLMKNTDDLIDGIPVDQQTGKAGLRKGSGNFLMAFADVHGLQVDSMGQNFCRRQVTELKSIAQQLALVFVNAAVLRHILHEKKQFLVGHFGVVVRLEETGNQLFPQGEQEVQWRQHPYPEPDKGRTEHGKAFRRVLCNAFGGDLTENQNNDRYDDRRNRRTHVAVKSDEQKCADRRHHDIDDIVADQDGGDQLVIIFGQLERQRCPLVSIVRQHLEAGLIQRRECRFCGAEIGGHGDAGHHCENASKIIHFRLLYVLFIRSFHAKRHTYTRYRSKGRRYATYEQTI